MIKILVDIALTESYNPSIVFHKRNCPSQIFVAPNRARSNENPEPILPPSPGLTQRLVHPDRAGEDLALRHYILNIERERGRDPTQNVESKECKHSREIYRK